MSKADNVLVEIFNHKFRLGSDSKDTEYIQKAAAYLDDKMKQAAIESGKKSPFDIAILAAMEIAEEVLDERAKTEHLLHQADEPLRGGLGLRAPAPALPQRCHESSVWGE